jgi:hypothetical protein
VFEETTILRIRKLPDSLPPGIMIGGLPYSWVLKITNVVIYRLSEQSVASSNETPLDYDLLYTARSHRGYAFTS